MYAEDLAKLTADHLRTHIKDYLALVAAQYTDKLQLMVPKTIDAASVVGGLITEANEILPAYGVDVLNVIPSDDTTSLWTHEYDGQINGLVTASSKELVDKLCLRHCSAVEHFILNHNLLHQPQNKPFTLIAFVGSTVEFSGAEDAGIVNEQQVWLAGFSINCIWLLSQDGPGQH